MGPPVCGCPVGTLGNHSPKHHPLLIPRASWSFNLTSPFVKFISSSALNSKLFQVSRHLKKIESLCAPKQVSVKTITCQSCNELQLERRLATSKSQVMVPSSQHGHELLFRISKGIVVFHELHSYESKSIMVSGGTPNSG